jgi:hypothetical protein
MKSLPNVDSERDRVSDGVVFGVFGVWEISFDGTTWQKDFELSYARFDDVPGRVADV